MRDRERERDNWTRKVGRSQEGCGWGHGVGAVRRRGLGKLEKYCVAMDGMRKPKGGLDDGVV